MYAYAISAGPGIDLTIADCSEMSGVADTGR